MFQMVSLLKSLAFTLLIVLLLQVKIGTETIEDRAVFWFRSSSLVQPLQTVVDGGVKVFRSSFNKVLEVFDFDLNKTLAEKPGHRGVKFQVERSRQYIRDQAERVARKMETELRESESQTSKPAQKNDWDNE